MAPVLRADRVSKSFGPIEVLSDVVLELAPGDVHAVIGENGAGKSTLMRILSGHLPPTRGGLVLDGEPVTLGGPVDAERRGIVLIHQEILLAEDLTVAQNLFLGREVRRGPFVDARAMRRRSAEALAELGSGLSPDTPVRRLSIADRQFVQIARALLVPHRVVIFDEPTAMLTPVEAEKLFAVIRRLRVSGVAVLYISHRLQEVKAVADRVTVLRDGRLVATREIGGWSPSRWRASWSGGTCRSSIPRSPRSPGRSGAARRRRPGAGLRGRRLI
jgi:ribose transport system ATP-binding protein